MFKNILFFICGIFISWMASFYYFSGLIKSSNELTKSVNNKSNYFKPIHSENALKIIKLNNKYIQKSMSNSFNLEQAAASQILLASSLFLSDITEQDIKTKEDIFLSMMMFYAQTKNDREFQDSIAITSEYCKSHTLIEDCSSDALLTMFTKFKQAL